MKQPTTMHRLKIPLDRGPIDFFCEGDCRLELLANRHGHRYLLVEYAESAWWNYAPKPERRRPKRLAKLRRGG